MRSSNYILAKAVLLVCSILIAQESGNEKKRKVYRTQTGSIIEAPKPLFNRVIKKAKEKTKKVKKKSNALARTKVVETTYRNELDSLKSTVSALLKQNRQVEQLLLKYNWMIAFFNFVMIYELYKYNIYY